MYEYQAVRVQFVGADNPDNPTGFERSAPIEGIDQAYVDPRVTAVLNRYAANLWDLASASLAGTETNAHALLVFRRELR